MSPRWLACSWLVMVAGCGDSTTGPTPSPEESEIPRAGYELLVESFTRAGIRTLSTMAPDGTRVLGFPGLPADARIPTPSPDGRSIAFARPTVEGDLHLWTMDRWTGRARLVLGGTILVEHVAWSPDGAKLAIHGSTFEESDGIWTLNSDGSGLKLIAADAAPAIVTDRYPTWSADGRSIAFQSNRTGLSRLWIMDADGANPRQVLPDLERTENAPAWSLDGSRIAFVDSALGIGLVAADGTGYRAVAIPHRPSSLAWTPDGVVVYSASDGIAPEIFALDPANGTSENLTRHPTADVRATVLTWVAPPSWRGLAAPQWIPSGGSGPLRVVAADVIADGYADVLVLSDSASIAVLRGTPGGLAPAGALASSVAVRDVAAADVSRDGLDDLILLASDELVVWRGGLSGPGEPTTHPLGGDARGLALGDFDLDGSADLAAVHDGGEEGFRMLVHSASSGDGTLVAVLDYSSTFVSPVRAAAGDVDGDGNDDVVVLASGPPAGIVWIPGQGDISFGPGVMAATASFAGSAVPLCVELDGDRREDLVVTDPSGAEAVHVLRSLGSTFDAAIALEAKASAVVAGDLDRDGDVDLVAAVASERRVLFLRNRGNGEFASPATVTGDREVVDLALRDLDGDGWLDLVLLGHDGSVGVALNRRR